MDPAVEVAVLETARGGLVRAGLLALGRGQLVEDRLGLGYRQRRRRLGVAPGEAREQQASEGCG